MTFRFTDPRGKWQHVTAQHVEHVVDEETLARRDSCSTVRRSPAGRSINESDMKLMPVTPRLSGASIRSSPRPDARSSSATSMEPSYRTSPIRAIPALRLLKQGTQDYHEASIGHRRHGLLRARGRVLRFRGRAFRLPRCYNTGTTTSTPRKAPTTAAANTKTAMSATARASRAAISRSRRWTAVRTCAGEMLSTMEDMGVVVEKHHHEVAPSQHELGMKFDTLVKTADAMQIYKYCVHMVAHSYGKTATFMPKPVKDDNGSGQHVHQSIWKDGQPLFAGSGYADLSENALYYIGGIIKHARALNAFTNASTNSYKRLVPGFEAPVLLAYSARNRSASCRIPYASSPKGKRVEVRFPDSTANPYLSYAAMLMAGLDGIANKIHPGDPIDKNLYDLPPEELAAVPTVCGSLREAVEALEADHEFLTKGDVFTKDMLEGYIDLKMEEVSAFETTPHPVEFKMYYSV